MTTYWQPCEKGRKLYEAYCREADAVRERGYYTTDPNQPVLVAMRAWEAHRDNCEQCKVKRDNP